MIIEVEKAQFDELPLGGPCVVTVAGTAKSLTVLERTELLVGPEKAVYSIRLGKVVKRG